MLRRPIPSSNSKSPSHDDDTPTLGFNTVPSSAVEMINDCLVSFRSQCTDLNLCALLETAQKITLIITYPKNDISKQHDLIDAIKDGKTFYLFRLLALPTLFIFHLLNFISFYFIYFVFFTAL